MTRTNLIITNSTSVEEVKAALIFHVWPQIQKESYEIILLKLNSI